jgi:hypothetical protein
VEVEDHFACDFLVVSRLIWAFLQNNQFIRSVLETFVISLK